MPENRTPPAPSRTVHTVDGTTFVTLHGEIDLLAATPLAAHLDALTSGPGPDLVLDLRPVSFIDCAGLAVLCRVRSRARARHGRLRLLTGSGRFLRILRAAGLGGVFEIQTEPSPADTAAPTSQPSATMG
ncbi:STAS domain-containing protein [Streptomyces sp. NPDC001668]|uniref:STAS domain-containing protein n=1 Tax=unclassified Streptomyces TaxID=2593676 RepID=UPI0036B84B72